ncbi:MAG: hypothetical protein M1372_02895 [Patescibacteria group bacterium]|nr:hypothetical protein [Patescibacteria group bacterium]
MDSTIERQPDGTIKLTITIPYSRVKETQAEILEEVAKNAKLPGFRRGKAPTKLVEKQVEKENVREEVLNKLLPLAYSQALKKHGLSPIMNPRIHVERLEDEKDWQFTALTCEAPEIDLNGYKENIKKITAKTKIIIPNKTPQQVSLDEIMTGLLKNAKVKIAKIIIEQEVQRLLAQTLDEIKKLGLTLDQYLASTHKTIEDLQSEYAIKAENDIKLEFALQKIAQEEKISVSDNEINEAIEKAKSEEERRNLEANKYLLASIIRQQKTLDFLKNL